MSNKNIFSKHLPSVNLSTRLDAQGHEVQVEQREDIDAIQKEQDTFDMLVGAGYYRAKIQGLPAFDKVVGGMVWCIECCDYGVDVNLLFHESFTIGLKIALVENLVSKLQQMKCPYDIEPHQIQGLEFLSIHPVIQWLVQTSVKNRAQRSEQLTKFAVSQFHNNYQYMTDKENLCKIHNGSTHIKHIQDLYAPGRIYPTKDILLANDERTRVRLTLAEFALTTERSEENTGDDMISNEAAIDRNAHIFNLQKRNEQHRHYTELKLEIELGTKELIVQNQLCVLEGTEGSLIKKLRLSEKENGILLAKLENEKASLHKLQQQIQTYKSELAEYDEIESKIDSEILERVQNLLKQHDDLKKEEAHFKEQCRKDLMQLQEQIKNLKSNNAQYPEDLPFTIQKEKSSIQHLKLQIAKKNRGILVIQRKIDALPDPIELVQYQQRFLELYNEMSSKHQETKQYFALYNTLNDQKRYMEKELSLLNSICEFYNENVQHTQSREEFLQEMEKVAESVRQAEAKMAQKYKEEINRRDALNSELQGLHELQREYVGAVRQLNKECQRCEQLQQHIRSIRANSE